MRPDIRSFVPIALACLALLMSVYAKRAREYEQVYEKPERQQELAWLRGRIPQLYRGRTVLGRREISAGRAGKSSVSMTIRCENTALRAPRRPLERRS